MKTGPKHNKGFTLVEMLIVVAIIAVLVVVAIPIYNAQLEKSRAQVCLNNRDALRRLLYADILLENVDEATFLALAAEHMEASQIVCPSGGTISARLNANAAISVSCDHHRPDGGAFGMGAGVPYFNFKNAITEAKKAFIAAGIEPPKSINSTDATSPTVQAMIQYFQDQGIDLSKSNIKSWTMVKKGSSANYDCYWTETDISQVNVNDTVLVMKYNEGSKTYTVGTMKVKMYYKEGGGGQVKGLNDSQSDSWVEYAGQDDDTKDSFETAYAIYLQAQEELNSTP